MDNLLLLCRPGFEADCAAELAWRDTGGGYARVAAQQGWLTWHGSAADSLSPRDLIFARTGCHVRARFDDLPEQDRLAPLLAAIRPLGAFSALRLEYPDTNEGRGLLRFLKRFRGSLERALRAQKSLGDKGPVLHLFFEDSRHGFIGVSQQGEAGDWENGIPRLRLAAAAPSRSAQKLEEAWLHLMTPQERAFWLRDGRTGVDLGAAPGGWTWQLARHGVRMTAIDHGKLAPALLEEYPVEHVRADAFTWRPPRRLDWLVCDVVDKPARTLALMEKWLLHDWARLALFNLKLPMKQRFATVRDLLARLDTALDGRGYRIRAAQLYYDREEITVLAIPEASE